MKRIPLPFNYANFHSKASRARLVLRDFRRQRTCKQCWVATIAAAFALLLFRPTAEASPQYLLNHVPAAVGKSSAVGRLPESKRLDLAISLPLRNREELTNLLAEISDRSSPNYRHYLTTEQFTEKFGPTEQDYEAVVAFAKSRGLKVTARHSNRMLVDVNGTVGQIQSALSITLREYQHPTESRTFYAPDTEPSVDLDTPVLEIGGLDNFFLPHPNLKVIPDPAVAQTSSLQTFGQASGLPNSRSIQSELWQPGGLPGLWQPGGSPYPDLTGSGPLGYYLGYDFRAAYVPGVTLTGTGQSVGLLEFDGYFLSDILSYESLAGLPNVALTNILLNGFNGVPGQQNLEVALDIEMAISMAPGQSQVIVYEGIIPNDILNQMAIDNKAKQLSSSWSWSGYGNLATMEQIFQEFAAQGQSFFEASGDNGAYSGPIGNPVDDPYITIVGGTDLITTGPRGAWSSETTWHPTGGGTSLTYPIPSWQQGLDMSKNLGSTTYRNLPDVALSSDNTWLIANSGASFAVSGTSISAPLWAGLTALINQWAVANGEPTVGFVNPAIYGLAKGPTYSTLFHDITTGNNTTGASPNKFPAVTGYDLCTGWGTPTGSNLINALALPEPLRITPGPNVYLMSGPVGGPFTPATQSFSLTNNSPSAFNWSVGNTPPWLTVSPTSGALTPGGGAATVNVSLTATASNLPAGTYNTTLRFTNLNSSFVQLRQFVLGVEAQPIITSQPTNQSVPAGATASFSVTTASNALLAFRWQLNGTNLNDNAKISGSTNNTLVIKGVAPTNTGTYSVTVSNPVGTTNSAGAQLTIIPSVPIITVQPTNVATLPAAPVTFSVAAIGDQPFTYQWQLNGTNLVRTNTVGINAATLTLNNVQPADSGVYSAIVSNALGYAGSTGAVLSVVSVTAPGVTLTPTVSFTGGTSANSPYGPLVQYGPGRLYGTTLRGGTAHFGTVFRTLTSVPGAVVLYNFSGGTTGGAFPYAGLAVGSDLNLYGTTYEGGTYGAGVLFKMNSSGTFTPLFFLNGNTGALPAAGLVQGKDGAFYGTTVYGGAYGYGTVFKRTTTAVYTNLISFNLTDGAYPSSVLIQAADGNFYGTTENGGAYGYGTVFRMSSSGAFTNLYSFTGGADGGVPIPGVVQASDGNFYGTTYQGGSTANVGTVFRMTPSGTLTTLYAFKGGDDGAQPWGGLFQSSDGNLYGVTQNRGTYNHGTAFRISPNPDPASPLLTLAEFDGFNGARPSAALMQASDGNLYGTTQTGGLNGFGTVFRLSFSGALQITGQPTDQTAYEGATAVFTVASFGGAPVSYQWLQDGTNLLDGGRISGSATPTLKISNVSSDDAAFYSVIVSNSFGSVTSEEAGLQVIASPPIITAQPTSQTVLAGTIANFIVVASGNQPLSYQWQANGTNLTDGGRISGSTTTRLAIGNVTAADAGNYSVVVSNPRNSIVSHQAALTVVPVTPSGVQAANLVRFNDDELGAFPYGALIQANDGNLYGLASAGGSSYYGSIFKLTLSGASSTIYSFSNGGDGSYPYGTLVQTANGMFYGVAAQGGFSGYGTIFEVGSVPGGFRALYSFSGNDGAYPIAGLTLATDGNFYGTVYQGGTYGYGAIFKTTATGNFTQLYSFSGGIDGAYPYAGLMQASDGNLYGVALQGGAYGVGTFFRIRTNGVFTPLASFSGDNGAYPQAALVQAPDGNLYGTAFTSTTNGDGTIFKATTDGRLNTLLWFNGTNGANPAGGLVVATDGNLYGTTSAGGPGGQGSAFQVTTNGTLRTLLWFGGNNGANPEAAMVQATNGIFYGTAAQGGIGYNPTAGGGNGVIFQITVPLFMRNPFTVSNAIAAIPYLGSIAGQAVYPPGDSVTFAKLGGPAWLSVVPDGTLSGTPADADIGTNIFTVNLSDTNGFSASATMQIFVYSNQPPAFVRNPFTEPWANLDQAYSASIATNATDPDPSDTLTFAKVGGPAWLNVAANGALSGTPSGSNAGTNQFVVSVTDLDGLSATATMYVYVNSPPSFNPGSFSKPAATVGLPYSGTIAVNAVDPDLAVGDFLTFYKVNGPAWLAVATNGILAGTPAGGDLGPNNFLVLVVDSGGLAGVGSMAIPVNADSPPAFIRNPFTAPVAQPGLAYSATIATNASDPDFGDHLTFAKLTGPAWLSVAASGLLSGTAASTDAGTNTFTVSVSDFAGLSNSATMFINVPAPIRLSVSRQAGQIQLSWTGGFPPYQVQSTTNLSQLIWRNVGGPVSTNTLYLTPTNARSWFRIQQQ
jgi:uncharacterized repeat protein (TIGR03803 family)